MRFEVDACRVFYCTLSERRLVADSCVLGRQFFFSLKKNGYVYYTTRPGSSASAHPANGLTSTLGVKLPPSSWPPPAWFVTGRSSCSSG